MIGEYAAENGATHVAKHYYTAVLGIEINESTARRFKAKYLEKLSKKIMEQRQKQADTPDTSHSEEIKEEPITITELETKPQGRLVLLGEELDSLVQEFILNLRAASGVVNTTVVMGAAEGIISYHDASKLSSHGEHINI